MEDTLDETLFDESEIDLLQEMVKEMFRMLNHFSLDYGMDFPPERRAQIIASFFLLCIHDDMIIKLDSVERNMNKSLQEIVADFLQHEQDAATYATAWMKDEND